MSTYDARAARGKNDLQVLTRATITVEVGKLLDEKSAYAMCDEMDERGFERRVASLIREMLGSWREFKSRKFKVRVEA